MFSQSESARILQQHMEILLKRVNYYHVNVTYIAKIGSMHLHL